MAFFASYLAIAHEAYEEALHTHGQGLKQWLNDIHLPIVKAEAEYHAPIFLGDSIELKLSVNRLGHSSFTLHTRFHVQRTSHHDESKWVEAACVKTVHVAVKDGNSTALPDPIRDTLALIGLEDRYTSN